ncbi:MAG: DNA repair protein RadC [Haliea sp.]
MNTNQTGELGFPYTYANGFEAMEQATIQEAIIILESRIREADAYTNPSNVKAFCRLQIAHELDEYFACMFLDNQHRLIAFERMFRGTVDGAAVYPRVVLRRALEHNAAALVFTHNHPSGVAEPSEADMKITNRLKDVLSHVDVRVLDHVIVGTEGVYSMAEHGRL